MPCRHAVRPEQAFRVDGDGETPCEGPMLCGWGQNSAPVQLVDVPRWLQRNALSGHLLNYPDDCMGCPCFSEAK